MTGRILFVAGSDTGVGKTLLTETLTRHLTSRGLKVAALKPFCSGGRADAIALWRAQNRQLPLDEVNPWHFSEPLAPALAAAIEMRRITAREAVRHIRAVARRHELTLVEGAGGLLSPLTADADARNLIRSLPATPVVVVANRLGAINQTLLVLDALPARFARKTRIVLMQQRRPDHSAPSNADYLKGRLGSDRFFEFPWLDLPTRQGRKPISSQLRRILDAVVK